MSPSSAFATQYIEDQLQASLRALLLRLRALSLACPGAPLIGLLLILLRHDHTLHYRLSLYLSYTDARKKGRESAFGFTELEPANAGAGAAAAEDAWNGQELRAQGEPGLTCLTKSFSFLKFNEPRPSLVCCESGMTRQPRLSVHLERATPPASAD